MSEIFSTSIFGKKRGYLRRVFALISGLRVECVLTGVEKLRDKDGDGDGELRLVLRSP